MMPLTVAVLADLSEPRMRRLEPPPEGVTFVVGERAEAFAAAAREAEALLAWWTDREALEAALRACPRVRWVHSVSAGVDRLLSPMFRERALALTNSRGVFSGALAEFALGAVLFFAKDFARMRRSQAAHTWDPFLVETLPGKTFGVLGYGDIGR